VEYVSDSSGFVRSEPVSGTLVWEVSPDPVPAGSPGGSFVLTGWVTMDPAMAGPLVNQVFIGSDLVDFDSGNDADEWSTELLRPDLGIAKGGPPLALFDTTITYTIVYSNAGNVPAEGVVITDILPGGVSYVSDDGGLLGLVHEEPTPGTHVWQVGPVTAGGGRGSFHVRAQVGSSLEVSPVVTNTVWIGARSPDSNPANDEDRQVTRVTQVRLYLPLIFRSHYPFR
jgi:uncharacterized repeat protein (TIGR01451 family)